MTSSTAWWHGPAGHFYNCLVDDPSETPEDKQMFEIAVHNVVPAASVKEKRFSWGIPATKERVESHFTEYDPRVREALSRVPEGLWKEFSSFSGPRLEKVTAWDKAVLIGDASHPLTGKTTHITVAIEHLTH
jgi:salicylate hydroxylase